MTAWKSLFLCLKQKKKHLVVECLKSFWMLKKREDRFWRSLSRSIDVIFDEMIYKRPTLSQKALDSWKRNITTTKIIIIHFFMFILLIKNRFIFFSDDLLYYHGTETFFVSFIYDLSTKKKQGEEEKYVGVYVASQHFIEFYSLIYEFSFNYLSNLTIVINILVRSFYSQSTNIFKISHFLMLRTVWGLNALSKKRIYLFVT